MVTLVHMLFMSIYQPYRALDNGPSTCVTHSSPLTDLTFSAPTLSCGRLFHSRVQLQPDHCLLLLCLPQGGYSDGGRGQCDDPVAQVGFRDAIGPHLCVSHGGRPFGARPRVHTHLAKSIRRGASADHSSGRHQGVSQAYAGGKHKWHLFLSHIWGTGQDQCATIKRQLLAYMPGLAVFLDVDDLEDIGELEAYIEQTAVMLIFVSKGYFKSKNCLREIRCSVDSGKPLVLMHDPVRGGATLEFIKAEECPSELHDGTFLRPGSGEERDVVTWHRIKVPACPQPQHPPSALVPQEALPPPSCSAGMSISDPNPK